MPFDSNDTNYLPLCLAIKVLYTAMRRTQDIASAIDDVAIALISSPITECGVFVATPQYL